VRTGIALALELSAASSGAWRPERLHEIIGDRNVADGIARGLPIEEIEARFADGLAAFRAKREKYLLYPGSAEQASR